MVGTKMVLGHHSRNEFGREQEEKEAKKNERCKKRRRRPEKTVQKLREATHSRSHDSGRKDHKPFLASLFRVNRKLRRFTLNNQQVP